MILYDLRCGNDHIFEAWFPDSGAFKAQAKMREVACPLCGDTGVVRAPMAPNVSTGGKGRGRGRDSMATASKLLTNVRALIEENCDDVGDKFAEEARKIHYGEADQRNIYGEATSQEADELREEGVEFGELPALPRRDS